MVQLLYFQIGWVNPMLFREIQPVYKNVGITNACIRVLIPRLFFMFSSILPLANAFFTISPSSAGYPGPVYPIFAQK